MGRACYHREMDESTSLPEFESHRYLSAPWRMRYLSNNSPAPGCVFCEKLAANDDASNLVVWRDDRFAAVMNLYPYSTGHLMLMPYAHVASPEDLTDPDILVDIAREIPTTMRAMRKVLRCQGFNTGMNTGTVAGAGIADHMHVHLVPRWSGDANFMPIVANVTVMPEALSVTYAKLRAQLIVEHDGPTPIQALVFSADESSVLLLGAGPNALPMTMTDDRRSLVTSMDDDLAALGIDAVIAGWAGDETVIWKAIHDREPLKGYWVPLDSLPAPLASLATEALARL